MSFPRMVSRAKYSCLHKKCVAIEKSSQKNTLPLLCAFASHLYVVQEELEIKAKDLKFSLLTRMRQRYMEEELMYDPLEKKHT